MRRGKELDLSRIRRAYRVRLDPTVEQRRALARYAGAARAAYNWALSEWHMQYRAHKLAARDPRPGARLTPAERARTLLKRWGSPLAEDPRWGWRVLIAAYERAARARRLLKRWGSPQAKHARYAAPHPNPTPNAYAIHARLTAARRGEIIIPSRGPGRVPGPWIATIPSLVLREAVADVGVAYDHFFRRLREGAIGHEAGEPRFRRRDDDHARLHVDQGSAIQLRADAIKLPVLGWIRVRRHQRGYIPTAAKICGIGISRHLDHWYAGVRVEIDAPVRIPERKRKVTDKKLGVEVGVRALVVMSDGRAILDHRPGTQLSQRARTCVDSHDERITTATRRLALWQRRMSRRHREGKPSHEQSIGWREAKRHVQRLYAKIAAIRDELLHYASRRIVDGGAEKIIMREPAVKSMIQRAGKSRTAMRARNALSPLVSQVGWYELRRRVEYKQGWMMASHQRSAEGSFIEVPAEHKTTRICSVCRVARATETSYPLFICTSCGHREDRDDNAAKVLRDFAPSSDGGAGGAGTTRRKTSRRAGTTAMRSGEA